MSIVRSIPSVHICALNLLLRHQPRACKSSSCQIPEISIFKHRYSFLTNRREQSIRSRRRVHNELLVVMDNIVSGAPQPPPPNFPSWAGWVLGSIFTIIIPFLTFKGGFLLKLGNKVEQVADAVEDVAETVEDVAGVVEDVAEAIEKASSEIADNQPKSGILKDAALWVENVSKELREGAQQTGDFASKVDDFAEEVDALMDSITDEKEEAVQKEAKTEGKREKVETVVGQTINEQKEAGEKAIPATEEAQNRQT